jgi:hypothetical protein
MPIIEEAVAGRPLSQGDVLKGIPLYFSARDPEGKWTPAGDPKKDLCLVLSRQCVVEHKNTLIVGHVAKHVGNIPVIQEFGEALAFLENLRDGTKSPDLFYLGLLPGLEGRHVAKLDYIATVQVPTIPDDRRAFVDTHRIARLNIDYVRALHVRVFQAFANMGFDDYRWVSDEDLGWLVALGNIEIKAIEQEQETVAAAKKMQGTALEQKELLKFQNKIKDTKARFAAYATESETRQAAAKIKPEP